MAKFPNQEGLNHAMGRTSIPCNDYKAGFTVYRWSGEEDDQVFPITAWLKIEGIPLRPGNRQDISKLLIKNAYVIKVYDHAVEKVNIYCARDHCDKGVRAAEKLMPLAPTPIELRREAGL